ncbi:hypothetical protein [Enterobacter sp. 22452]|uniref:hypothetical protein n=1 Tax=Enterobacter TaxID=547 RepID=UPI003F8726FD
MPQLFLYEPRMLMRSAVCSLLHDAIYSSLDVYPRLTSLSEDVCGADHHRTAVLAGMDGAGTEFARLLRLLSSLIRLQIKTIVWLPSGYPHVAQLLRSIGVNHLLLEDDLEPGLTQFIRMETSGVTLPAHTRHQRTVSQNGLDIMLQFASGLSAKEISQSRGCSHKTIFSWKHNLCDALGLQHEEHWFDVLTEIAQLSTPYQTR